MKVRSMIACLFGLVCAMLTNVSASAEPGPHAVAFLYHHFGVDRYPSTNVTMTEFDAHLDYLAGHGYHVWPLARIVAHLRSGEPIPDHTVAITIDDAYLSVYENAYPRLRKRGWPFTVFVSTDAVDKGYSNFMSWAQMREMQAHGASFANHSATHDHLIKFQHGEDRAAWSKRVRADIARAAKRLKSELGESPPLFAYPYGEYNAALAALVRDMGYVGIGQQSGALGANSDLRALPRFPMAGQYASLDQFRTKAETLPLPVLDYQPFDPVVSGTRRPRLRITLATQDDAMLGRLGCYVSGQGRVQPRWLEKGRRFEVRAERPLPDGRSRYNCTAPAGAHGRFYWFSQQWVIEPGAD
jgi:peptidoglycan/xylan/chitin deacetylase (PgdA/CDA1 family)